MNSDNQQEPPVLESDSEVQQKSNDGLDEKAIGTAMVAAGTAVGAGVSATVGGMGLAVAGTAVGLGMAPVAATGAVFGSAVYGIKKAIEDQDETAIDAAIIGAGLGAGASAIVGGMGLAVAGTAVGITMAPVAAAGAVIGLAGYGFSKLLGGNNGQKKEDEKK
jgi:hypothetical protein